jgi:dTDP-4-amino-4,6-dideoxygalactose transaminase
LHVKLNHLSKWNDQRTECAAEYDRLLVAVATSMILPYEPSWSRAVYHLYVVRIEDREGFMAHLKSTGIGTGIHYPIPLHLQKAYRYLGYGPGDFPVCEKVADQIVSLPMFPQMTAEQQHRVVEESVRFVQSQMTSKHLSAESDDLAIAEQPA